MVRRRRPGRRVPARAGPPRRRGRDPAAPARRDAPRRAASASQARGADSARLAHHAEAAGDARGGAAPRGRRRRARRPARRPPPGGRAVRPRAALGRRAADRRAGCAARAPLVRVLSDRSDGGGDRRPRGGARGAPCSSGTPSREGDARRWLSRLYWFHGRNDVADRYAAEAIAQLEALPPGPELAMAYSNRAQLAALSADRPGAEEWGNRAIALAERLGETRDAVARAQQRRHAPSCATGSPAGARSSLRSLEIALADGLEEHVARAYSNLVLAGRPAPRAQGRGGRVCGRHRLLRTPRPRLVAALPGRLARDRRAAGGRL